LIVVCCLGTKNQNIAGLFGVSVEHSIGARPFGKEDFVALLKRSQKLLNQADFDEAGCYFRK
jgi:hypothetical protein